MPDFAWRVLHHHNIFQRHTSLTKVWTLVHLCIPRAYPCVQQCQLSSSGMSYTLWMIVHVSLTSFRVCGHITDACCSDAAVALPAAAYLSVGARIQRVGELQRVRAALRGS